MQQDWFCTHPDPALRARAVSSSEAGELVDVGATWPELVGGHRHIVDAFHTSDRCFLLLEAHPPERDARRLDRKAVQILEHLLNGDSLKVTAFELGLSESYVSTVLRQSAERLGLRFRVSNMPTLLMMAAHATRSGVRMEGRRVALAWKGANLVALSAARPDRALSDQVSAAEYAVVRLLVEGHRHSEIAALRGTSVRTIANQIGSVFRKLEVSGRSQLLTRLFVGAESGADMVKLGLTEGTNPNPGNSNPGAVTPLRSAG